MGRLQLKANKRSFAGSLLLAACLVAGCHAAQLPAGPILLAGAPQAAAEGTGSAQVTFELPADKLKQALGAKRSVQSVDLARASYIRLFVAGAGINGWSDLTGGNHPAFGTPNTQGIRTASFTSASVPAGLRRIFRLGIYEGGSNALLEEFWGVADINVGQTTTLSLTGASTPVGQVFRKLVLGGDAAKALNLSVASVQTFVDQLLNTDHTTGAALDGTKPQIHWSLLNTDLVSSAIANGENGTPYTVPSVLPSYLTPTPVRKASVTVKALGVDGQPITSECVVFLNDQASPILRSTAGQAASLTFPDVTPGNWTATVVDTGTGRTASVGLGLPDGANKSVSVTLPPQDISRVVGAYNLDTNTTSGYNGEFNPPTLACLANPCGVAMNNGVLYWADVNNQRIRCVDLNSNQPIVKTVAGNGTAAASVAPEGSNANQVPIKIDGNCAISFDQNDNVLFSEQGFSRVAKVDKSTGLLTTLVTTGQVTGFDTSRSVGPIWYDKPSHTLYLGNVSWILDMTLCSVNMDTFPAAGSSAQVTNRFSGGLLRSGKYLFYATGYQGGYQIIRRDLTDGTNTVIAGKNRLYRNGDGVAAQDFYCDVGSSGGGSAYSDFSLDDLGNLYFIGYPTGSSIFRITDVLNGTDASNDWVANNLAVSSGASGAHSTAWGTGLGLFFSGTAGVPNPNGAGSVGVDAINLLKP